MGAQAASPCPQRALALRVVLDTNVLVSGLQSPKGPPGRLIRAWASGCFELVTSEAQLSELRRTLRYPKLRKRIPKHVAGALINAVKAKAAIVKPSLPSIEIPDEDDQFILGTAIAGKADFLVTGDRSHSLALKKIGSTRIVDPTTAVQLLGVKGGR